MKAAHYQRRDSPNASPQTLAALQPDRFHPESREAHELLEQLDDAMFLAIGGDPKLVDAARKLWAVAQNCLTSEQLEESREQYLRYALELTRVAEYNAARDPSKMLVAVEMIELLTGP
jgi:hypothetical protein